MVKKVYGIAAFTLLFAIILGGSSFFLPHAKAALSSSQDWQKLKYGLFVHNVYSGSGIGQPLHSTGGYAADIDEFVDAFDVGSFADDVEAMGFDYVIFTAWQGTVHLLYPSPVTVAWRGSGYSATSRDLVGEIIDALAAKGIKTILYTHFWDGHDMHPWPEDPAHPYCSTVNPSGIVSAEQAATGYCLAVNGSPATWKSFNNDMYDELLDKYGSRIAGVYFDSAGDYGRVDLPHIRASIDSKCPDCVLVGLGMETKGPYDTGEKEIGGPTNPDPGTGMASGGDIPTVNILNVDTWKAYTEPVSIAGKDNSWGAVVGGSIAYNADTLFKYTVLQAGTNTDGLGVAWGLGTYGDGTFETNVVSNFDQVKTKLAAISESIRNTNASTSYVTPRSSQISNLANGIVATKALDNFTEYIHVLKPPVGSTVNLPVPDDGKIFGSAVMLRSGNPAAFVQDGSGVHITVPDAWDPLDTVIKLSVSAISTNYALNAVATADSVNSTQYASKAVDGDKTSTDDWMSGPSEPHWLQLDLGSPQTISRWKLFHETNFGATYHIRDFKLQKSSDGLTWTDVDTVVGNTAGKTDRNVAPFTARYVRLYISDSGTGDTYARVREFEVWNTPAVSVVNVALGAAASADTVHLTQYASKAVDGDKTSTNDWMSEDIEPHWLALDLGSSKTISKWKVYHETDFGSSYHLRDFMLQKSSDGTTWTNVDSVVGNTAGTTDRNVIPFTARYVRLYITDSGTGDTYARVREFEVWGTPALALENLTLNKTATADSVHLTQYALKAVDGDKVSTNDWMSTDIEPHWLKIDLGSTKTISNWKLFHETNFGSTYHIRDFKLQKSNDGTTWTDVDIVVNNASGLTDRYIIPFTARYVRLYITDSGTGDTYARVREFEVWGN